MPTFKVKAPDGRSVTLRGDAPPTDADLDGIFASLPTQKKSTLFKGEIYGGLPSYVGGGRNAEDALPMIGQTVGSTIPGVNAFGGSVAGATAGQAARQGIKAIRGTRDSKPRKLFGVLPTAPGIVNDLAGEAAGTATLEGVFRGGGKLIEPAANRLMLSVMKPARELLKRRPNLGLEAAEAGIVGTKSGMLNRAEKLIEEGEKQIAPLLKNNPKQVNILNVAADLDEVKRPFINVGDDAAIKAIEEVQNNLLSKSSTGMIGLEEGNQLKRDLYKVLKSSQYGKGIGEVPVKATARKQAAYGIRKEIEGAVPAISGISKKQSVGIEAKEALENRIASESKNMILPKLASMGFGGAILSGNPMTGAGILLGDRAVDLLRSAPTITGAAKNLLRLKKSGRPLTIATAEMARRFNQ